MFYLIAELMIGRNMLIDLEINDLHKSYFKTPLWYTRNLMVVYSRKKVRYQNIVRLMHLGTK